MAQNVDLKEMERRAWRSVFQDGLWDIYFGMIMISFAVSAWLDKLPIDEDLWMVVYIGVMVFSLLVLYLGKRFITIPRLGRVKFGAKRQRRRNIVRLILFASVLLGVLMWLLSASGFVGPGGTGTGKWTLPMVWALNMLLVFGLGAYFLEYDRLYVIGFLFALVLPLDMAVKAVTGVDLDVYIFLTAGMIILAMGFTVLIRFLHDNKPLNLSVR